MITKANVTLFIIMFLPMLVISALLNLVYSLNTHDYIQINWLIVIILAIILDAFMILLQRRKNKENKTE